MKYLFHFLSLLVYERKSESDQGALNPFDSATGQLEDKDRVLDPTSQAIARYLIEHGREGYFQEGSDSDHVKRVEVELLEQGYRLPGHHRIDRVLDDGRRLSVYYCNINNRPVEDPMPNSRLELSLHPVREDQFGYSTTEHGLSGNFDCFQFLFGVPSEMGAYDLEGFGGRRDHTSFTRKEELLIDHLQRRYDKFRIWVLEELKRGGGENDN
ncbi:MAG: hypothetical protein PHF67_01490 [Candidatus Nanoarchaeia archaeon]|nr:hypothetical protein [Candidatus Nanoarchaeia archaeon]